MSIISQVLPHAGDMVLIDEIVSITQENIECCTRSHLLDTNPLRNKSGLPMTAALEYGAQAVALHGLLNLQKNKAKPQTPKPTARIIAVKSASWGQDWLHTIEQPLIIRATRLTHLDSIAHYSFELTTSTHQAALYQAQVTVLLNNQT